MVEALHKGGLLLVGQEDVHPIKQAEKGVNTLFDRFFELPGSYEKASRQF